ncbi:GNAT family N-acetyltransferase [Azospira sp. I09]|jgi:RimJ/RimL family protein N-acetyltransferase|uniref:GNAT family N-acetyltransferase n=1 Tax=Azospira sp. I09 TaxID=1765049 RepID=UPI0012604872|nr:GNAT family N-acetyltransferase [Azospira sp. I09]BBN88478.1 hypothetical protein AZSP09_15010 [Azospira sp. I09]
MVALLACMQMGPISITPLEIEDTKAIAHLGRHPEVFQYIPEIKQPFDAETWCKNAIDNGCNHIRHLIKVGPQRTPVGYVQICRRLNMDLELGYWIGKEYWGHGIASAAASLALVLFVSAGGSPKVFAATKPDNPASRRVLEKLGFLESSESQPPEGMIDHLWSPA